MGTEKFTLLNLLLFLMPLGHQAAGWPRALAGFRASLAARR
jgi:hypothetical protein